MTCMAGAGRQDREKINMALDGRLDKVGLFFVHFFGAILCLVAGMEAAGVSCGLHGKEGRKETCGWEGVCLSSLQGELIGVGHCLSCT